MKIIDEQGKIFGKINMIDFMVVALLVCMIPVFYYVYQTVLIKNRIKPDAEFVLLDLHCRFIAINPDAVRSIAVGDKEFDKAGNVIGEVTWIGESKQYKYIFDIGKAVVISKDVENMLELPVRLKLRAEAKDQNLYYKERRVVFDSPIVFQTHKYTVKCLINEKPITRVDRVSQVEMNLVFKNLDEELCKVIAPGDKEFDDKGQLMAEIVDVGRIEKNTIEVDLGNQNYTIAEDSTKKQVNARLRIKVEIREDGSLYYKSALIGQGNMVEFHTDKYSIKGYPANIFAKERWVQLKVKFSGITADATKGVMEGDNELDMNRRIIARVSRRISERPSDIKMLAVKEDKFVSLDSPYQRDLVLLLDVLCESKNGILYYKNYPVQVGNLFDFTTEAYSISGTIVSMELAR
jgi:hypothetical protein